MIINLGQDGANTADKVEYNNSTSGLQANNVQGAVDELSQKLVNLRLPDYANAIILPNGTLDAQGKTWTAPNDGIIQCHFVKKSNGTASYLQYKVDNIEVIYNYAHDNVIAYALCKGVVSKNDVITCVNCINLIMENNLIFIPFKS